MKNLFSKLVLVLILCLAVVLGAFAVACSATNEDKTAQDEQGESATEEEAQEKVLYALSYASGGGSGTAPNYVEAYSGDYVIVAANTFTNDGLEFLGWSDGSALYQPGDIYVMKANNIVLTATWNVPATISMEYTEMADGTLVLSSCTTSEVVVTVPAMNNGKYVASIAKDAFKSSPSVTSIILPDCLQTIEEGAFAGLGKLTSITVPFVGSAIADTNQKIGNFGYIFGSTSYSGSYSACGYYLPNTLTTVTVLGGTLAENAFEDCANIKTISLQSDDIETISASVFKASGLKKLTISESVKNIDASALEIYNASGSPTLENISVVAGNKVYSSEDGILYSKNGKTLIKYPANKQSQAEYSCASTVSSIADRAFAGATANISLEATAVKAIGKHVFDGYKGQSITFGSALESIEAGAFMQADELVSLYVEDNNRFHAIYGAMYENDFQRLICLPQKAVLDDAEFTINSEIIDEGACYNVAALTNVKLNGNVNIIGDYAFAGTGVTILNIPCNVYDVGKGVISSGVINFERTTAPKSFEAGDLTVNYSVGVNTCGDWNYVLNGSSAVLTAYIGTQKGEITIPEQLDEHIVEYLVSAFWGVDGITNVVLSSALVHIGAYAFVDCECLGDFETGTAHSGLNLTSVGSHAFEGLTIGSLYLKNLTLIGANAFANTHFSTSSSVTIETAYELQIKEYAFAGSDITSININPSQLSEIHEGAFYGSALQSVKLNSCFTAINSKTFANCASLTSVDLSAAQNLETIGEEAFANCSALETIEIPDSVSKLSARAFAGCTSLKEFDNADAPLYDYGDSAFEDCVSLPTIDLAKGTLYIGTNCFAGCYNLVIYCEDTSSPNDYGEIGGWKDGWNGECPIIWNSSENYVAKDNSIYFFNNDNLYRLYNSEITLMRYNGGVITSQIVYSQSASYPLTQIAKNAYAYTDVEEVIVPSSVTYIAAGAFRGAYKLRSLSINYIGSTSESTPFGSLFGTEYSDGMQEVAQKITINGIKDTYTYYIPKTLATLNISGGTVESGELCGLTMLKVLTLGNKVTVKAGGIDGLGNTLIVVKADSKPTSWSALWNKEEYPVVWNNVTMTADDGYTYSLENGSLYRTKESVKELYSYSSSAESVSVIAGVTSIYAGAFADGEYKEVLASASDKFAVQNGVLYTADLKTLVLYPSESSAEEFVVPGGVERIGAYAFYNAKNLKAVTLGEDVTFIGVSAFAGSGILNVTIPAKVETIGTYAFNGCENLSLVTISQGSALTCIGNYAFADCGSLAEFVGFESGLNDIGAWAFANCQSLKSVFIPASVVTIREYAFYNCGALTINCDAACDKANWATTWNYDLREVVVK